MANNPTRKDLEHLFEERGSRYATVAFADLQGQLRGKTVNAEKLLSSFPAGVPFSPLNLMLDFGDHVLFPKDYLSPDQSIGDNDCDIDWQHPRTLPFEDADSNLFFFANFTAGTQGALWDPRGIYRGVEAMAKHLGFNPVYGIEYEYRLLQETPQSLRDKHFTDLQLVSDVSSYGGVMHQSAWSGFFKDMRAMCDEMNIKIASMHWEVAASMGELALYHQPGIDALDDAVLFKTHAKVLAKHHDLTLTFMARPMADEDGQSGHVHLSLLDNKGSNVFFHRTTPNKTKTAVVDNSMSIIQRHFIGGLQQLLPQWLLMLAPNINSFKRFVPGIYAPISADWGIDNRTSAIRVIPGGEQSQRLELRVPGSDTNPYLVCACMLAAGLHGITEKIEPSAATEGASHLLKNKPKAHKFPNGFAEAIDWFQQSALAKKYFGEDFVAMYAGSRQAQLNQFEKMVSNVELKRFLELA